MKKNFNLSSHDLNRLENINLQKFPFKTVHEMFNFRASASYYLCWYTLNMHPLFVTFSEPCNGIYLSSNGMQNLYYDHKAKSNNPYSCAELSFCPDPCCSKSFIEEPPIFKNASDNNYKEWHYHCLTHATNPCKNFSDGFCELSKSENSNLDDLKQNKLNVTCQCPKGFEYSNYLKGCIDIDECLEKIDSCNGYKQSCLNIEGSFICLCEDGFTFKPPESIEKNSNLTDETMIDLLEKHKNNMTCYPQDASENEERSENYNLSIIEKLYEEL